MKLNYIKKSILGIISTLSISLIIIYVFNIPLHEITAFTLQLLLLSLIISLIRLISQAVRFYILLRLFSNADFKFSESILMRGSSEFFALTTLPFLADEAARTFMLIEKGLPPTTSFSIAFTELILDTVVGAILSFPSGLYALMLRERVLAVIILLISLLQITLSLMFIVFSKEKRIHFLEKIKPFIAGRKHSSQLITSMLKDGAREYSRILGSIFSTKYIVYLTLLVMLTIIVILTPAIILYGILLEYGYNSFLNALYAFRSGEILGLLPVTIGGAGLTEAGVYLYMERVLGIDSWSSVIKWRIATYYITLIITSSMLVLISIKYFKRSLTQLR
jgi:hypothetical protein